VPSGARRAAIERGRRSEANARTLAEKQTASTPSWTAIGPRPILNEVANFGGMLFGPPFNATGRVTALVGDAQGRVYVGTASGGVWLSTDNNATFTPITDSLPTQAIGLAIMIRKSLFFRSWQRPTA